MFYYFCFLLFSSHICFQQIQTQETIKFFMETDECAWGIKQKQKYEKNNNQTNEKIRKILNMEMA